MLLNTILESAMSSTHTGNKSGVVLEGGMLTQEMVKRLLDYDPETGVFTWTSALGPQLAGRRAGSAVGKHYRVVIDGKSYLGGRLAWFYVTGAWPSTLLRFNDGNPSNLRFSNLRESVSNAARREAIAGRKADAAAFRGKVNEDGMTRDILASLLRYEPDTGNFYWLEPGHGRKLDQPAGAKNMGHRTIRISGEDYQVQRLAWLYVHGKFPANGGRIKFVNGDTFDCRIDNLRLARTKKEAGQVFRDNHPHKNRENMLRRYEGMDITKYTQMLIDQGSVCAACNQPETVTRNGKVRWLCVDHDHETNAVRGLLCVACNTAIGYAKDDPARLEACAAYLRRHHSNVIPLRSA